MIASLLALSLAAASAADVELWRLDCGEIVSDKPVAEGGWDFTDSCYLIRHGSEYLLWDAGLDGRLVGSPYRDDGQTLSLNERLTSQLARVGLSADEIRRIAISHYHADHSGQALDFPGATLLIGRADWEAIKASDDAFRRNGVKPWLDGAGKVDPVEGDRDIFGDGSVVMLATPGHTPGHHSLLVRLKASGAVLLSGDQVHTRAGYERNDVPGNATSRDDAIASGARFREIAAREKARVIIQHDRGDVALLPAFPHSAR